MARATESSPNNTLLVGYLGYADRVPWKLEVEESATRVGPQNEEGRN